MVCLALGLCINNGSLTVCIYTMVVVLSTYGYFYCCVVYLVCVLSYMLYICEHISYLWKLHMYSEYM